MALSVVTATLTELRANTGTSASGQLGQAPANGNLLVAGFAGSDATAADFSVADNASTPNTWTRRTFGDTTSPAIGVALCDAASVIGTTAGAAAITVTCKASGSSFGCTGFVYEVAGASTTNPFGEAAQTSNGAATTSPATPSLTNTSAADIVFGMFFNDDGNPESVLPGLSAASQAAGWVLPNNSTTNRAVEDDGNNYAYCAMAYRIVSTSAAQSCTFTSVGAFGYASVISTYTAAGGSSPAQNLSVSQSTAPRLSKAAGPHLSLGQSTAALLHNGSGKALTLLQPAAALLGRVVGKGLAGVESSTASLTRGAGKTLFLGQDTTTLLPKGASRVLWVVQASSAVLGAARLKIVGLAVVQATAAEFSRVVAKALLAPQRTTATLAKGVTRTLARAQATLAGLATAAMSGARALGKTFVSPARGWLLRSPERAWVLASNALLRRFRSRQL